MLKYHCKPEARLNLVSYYYELGDNERCNAEIARFPTPAKWQRLIYIQLYFIGNHGVTRSRRLAVEQDGSSPPVSQPSIASFLTGLIPETYRVFLPLQVDVECYTPRPI